MRDHLWYILNLKYLLKWNLIIRSERNKTVERIYYERNNEDPYAETDTGDSKFSPEQINYRKWELKIWRIYVSIIVLVLTFELTGIVGYLSS